MKQTAVEWLAKELESYGDPQICTITWEDLDSLVNQAKELEKQQIIDACQQGFYDGVDLAKIKKSEFKSAQEYYNETFNTKNQ